MSEKQDSTSNKEKKAIYVQSILQAQVDKLTQENDVLKKQKERATKENESFRNQAVSQLKSLQKTLADKNKLIKSLRLKIKNTTPADADSTATTTSYSSTAAATIAKQNADLAKSKSVIKLLQNKVEELSDACAEHEEREEELTLLLDGKAANAVIVDDEEATEATAKSIRIAEENATEKATKVAEAASNKVINNFKKQIKEKDRQLEQQNQIIINQKSLNKNIQRELETVKSDLARANARVRQLEDDSKATIKKYRIESKNLNSRISALRDEKEETKNHLNETKESLELYRKQQEEFVNIQNKYNNKIIEYKKKILQITSEKSEIDIERQKISEELTRERIVVETERRQRHELISKSESDSITKRQKLSRRVTKLTNELQTNKNDLMKMKDQNNKMKIEMMKLLETTEAAEKNYIEIQKKCQKEKEEHTVAIDNLLKEHHEHVTQLRLNHDMKIQKCKENMITSSTVSSVAGENDGVEDDSIKDVQIMREKMKKLEMNVASLEKSLETLRKVHAARVSELIKRHKSTIKSLTGDVLKKDKQQEEPTIATNMNTPAKRLLLSGSPMTMDKFEASLIHNDDINDANTLTKKSNKEQLSTTSFNASLPSSSSSSTTNSITTSSSGEQFLPNSPSSYYRQLKLHHQTTLREFSQTRLNCERMIAERTSYISQISSMDVQMKAMQELVQQLEGARDTMKLHHKNEKDLLEKQMLRLIKGLKICRSELDERKKEVKKIKKSYTKYLSMNSNSNNAKNNIMILSQQKEEKNSINLFVTPHNTPRKEYQHQISSNSSSGHFSGRMSSNLSNMPGVRRSGAGNFGSSTKKKIIKRKSAKDLITPSKSKLKLTPKQKRDGLKLHGLLEPMLITMNDLWSQLKRCEYETMLTNEEECYGMLPQNVLNMSTQRLNSVVSHILQKFFYLYFNV
jgi:hypothetical protein